MQKGKEASKEKIYKAKTKRKEEKNILEQSKTKEVITQIEKEQEQENEEKNPFFKSKKGIFIIIIIAVMMFVSIITITVILVKKKKITEGAKNNSINAIFKVEEGEEVNLFNPDLIGLKEGEYTIEIKNKKDKNLRRLKNKNNLNYKYIPEETGEIVISIIFNINITSMHGLFKDCPNLISIDLSYLYSTEVKNLTGTFQGCLNLENINFTNFNTRNVESMNSMFENCTKIVGINLTEFNTTKVIKMNNMFSGCTSLIMLDLSNFIMDNVNLIKDMFKNCPSLQQLDLPFFESINDIFEREQNISGIVINLHGSINSNVTCQTGENEFCKSCSQKSLTKMNCETCNEGYFLPNTILKPKCEKCLVENCEKCLFNTTCSICKEGYVGYRNQCVKLCILGENEKCRTCLLDGTDNCQTCNDGYYLGNGLNNVCAKCSLDNCYKCNYDTGIQVCDLCNEGFTLINGKCEEKCKEKKDKCKTCNKEQLEQCLLCENGYYLPIDNKKKCKKCQIDNCISCFGTEGEEKCSKCEYGFTLKNNHCAQIIINTEGCEIGEGDKCKSCDNENPGKCSLCNLGYEIENGLCYGNYSFKAVYYTSSASEKIKIINFSFEGDLIVDGKNVEISENYKYRAFYYTFNSAGYHTVTAKTGNKEYANEIFKECKNLVNITLTPLFDFSQAIWVYSLFEGCSMLENVIIMKKYNVEKITWMYRLFYGCINLKSIDLSYFLSFYNAFKAYEMFYGCNSLKYIDISTFNSCHKESDDMFHGIPSNGTIKIGPSLNEQIKNRIPVGWNIIPVN